MKIFFNLTTLLFLCWGTIFAQGADPSISGATFASNIIETGETTTLDFSFVNTGFTDIPANSVEITIATANTFYTTDGTTNPTGPGSSLFTWTYLGSDVWRGTNNTIIGAFGGGDISFTVSGIAASVDFETTNINVQPVANFGAFSNETSNDNQQPTLRVDQGTGNPCGGVGGIGAACVDVNGNNSTIGTDCGCIDLGPCGGVGGIGAACVDVNGAASTIDTDCSCILVIPTCNVGEACTDSDGDASVLGSDCNCVEVDASIGTQADPAVTGATYSPNQIEVGAKSTLTVSFANTGSTAIPANSIEITIATASSFYTTDGVTIPSGIGGDLFNWTYVGVDVWRGSNNGIIPAFGGGDIVLEVMGMVVSDFETTNINVQPVANFGAFSNESSNDNLQPTLRILAPVVDCAVSSPTVSVVRAVDPTCAGDADGRLEFDATYATGVDEESIVWNSGLVNGRVLNNAAAATYTFTALDLNGCSTEVEVTLDDPTPISVSSNNIVDEDCTTFGSLTLTGSGGLAPYTFSGDLTADASGNVMTLLAGTYTVVATDANGCVSFPLTVVIENLCPCVDLDKDGVCAEDDCDDNDPSIQHGPGSVCDDGDVCTEGDVYDADCNCVGTPIITEPILVGVPDDVTVQCDAIPDPAVVTSGSLTVDYVEDRIGADNCNYELTRTWSVNDGCGNIAIDIQIITVEDDVAPVLAGVPGDITINVNNGDPTPPVNVTATDNCDLNPTVNFVEPFIVIDPCSNQTTYSQTWSAIDACGNTSDAQTRMVTVIDDDFLEDADGDGVCDRDDICPGGDDTADGDNDGTPDFCDTCDGSLAGQPCSDGDACTEGDVYDANCNCAGTFADADGDGVCDSDDICPGGDDNADSDNDGIPNFCDTCDGNLAGQPCSDGDACTEGDVYDANCNCAGTFADADGDGVCDSDDICPGGDDNADSDNDGIPNFCDTCDGNLAGQPCSDGDACTEGDVYDANCNCAGTFADADGDGVCDSDDICPGHDDAIDSNNNGTPDGCEQCDGSLIVVLREQENISCNGANDGKLVIEIQGGDGPYTISWTNGPTTLFNSNLSAGTYTVTVKDVNDCETSQSFTITEPTPLQVNVVEVTPQGCDLNTGAIDIEVFGGTAPYTYNWIAFADTEDITDLNARNYQLEVTDANGCKTNRLTIAVPLECGCNDLTAGGKIGFSTDCSQNTIVCAGQNNTLIGNCTLPSGGSGTIEYIWLKSTNCPNRPPTSVANDPDWMAVPNSNTNTLVVTNLSQTTCFIRCARRSGCEDYLRESNIVKIEVNQNAPTWYADTDGDTFGDPNNSVVACDQPLGYVLNSEDCDDGDASIPSIPGSTCDDGDPNTINDEIQIDGCTCEGEDILLTCPTVNIEPGTGKVTISGLTSPRVILGIFEGLNTVYACNNNCQETEVIPLTPGNYRVLIQFRDQFNHRIPYCDNVFESFTIEESCIDKDKDGYCEDQDCDDNDSSVPATPGSTCDDGDAATINDQILADGCGCAGTPILTCDLTVELANQINPGCADRNDGIVAVRVSQGQAPYTYRWSNGRTGVAGITQLAAGDYTVTVTDANGCVVVNTYTLVAPDPIMVTETIVHATCGQANGSISLVVSGGNGDYQYIWNGTPSTASQTNLGAGNYTVIIRDNMNCERIHNYRVEDRVTADCETDGELQSTRCDFEVRYTNNSISIDGNVARVIIFEGFDERENIVYACQGNCATSRIITNIPPGNYGVKILSADFLCIFDERFIAEEGTVPPDCDLMVELVLQTDLVCSDRNSGALAVQASSGQAPYSYAWSNGITGSSSITQLAAGAYTVTVTDANDCEVVKTYTLVAPDPIMVSETIVHATCGQNNGAISLVASGGNGNYQYIWNGTPSTASQTNLAAGSYNVVVRDGENCERIYNYIIENRVTSACNGGGEIQPTTCDFEVRYSNNSVSITGNVARVIIFEGFNEQENIVYTCQGNCPTSEVVANIPPGNYGVKIFGVDFLCIFDQRFIAEEGTICSNAGMPCDDGNDCTIGDTYDANCNCISGTLQDDDGDGVCNEYDCAPTDANYPKVPGTGCDDGNSNTENDMIQADGCGCEGTPINNGEPDCTTVTATPGRGTITIAGLTSPNEQIRVYLIGRDRSWTEVADCVGDCGDTWVAENLAAGDYIILFTLFNADWMSLCESGNIQLEVTVLNGASSRNSSTSNLSIDKPSANDLIVYPNPAQQTVNLDLSKWANKPVNIAISNHLSQVVYEQHIEQVVGTKQIDLTNFVNGIYYIQVQGTEDAQPVVKKLIVNRLY